MKVRIPLLFLCTIVNTLSYSQGIFLKPDSAILFEVTQGKSLLEDCSGSYYQNLADSFWVPSQQEYADLQANFYKKSEQVEDFLNYIVQYVGVTIKGEKFIYINAFPKYQLKEVIRVHKNLNQSAVVACGGGILYWRVLFNCRLKEFTKVRINAPK